MSILHYRKELKRLNATIIDASATKEANGMCHNTIIRKKNILLHTF